MSDFEAEKRALMHDAEAGTLTPEETRRLHEYVEGVPGGESRGASAVMSVRGGPNTGDGRSETSPHAQSVMRAGLLRQVAAEIDLDKLINDRLDARGAEVHGKPAADVPAVVPESRDERSPSLSVGPEGPSHVERIGVTGQAEVTREASGPVWRTEDGRPAVVERGQRWADHELVREHAERNHGREEAVMGMHGSLGNMVRSMTTTSGAALVPTEWQSAIIDRARALAAVTQAGAQLVPMPTKTVQIGRLSADPVAAFRAEGSTITASDPTFDNVTLVAKTMNALVVGSLEWFQDSQNVDEVVREALAAALATQLDFTCLMGGVTTGGEGVNLASPPNPRGVLASLLADASSSVLGGLANGTNITPATPWNEILDTVYTPRQFNEEPNALLWAPKMAQKMAKTYLTTNEPLPMPADVSGLQRYMTTQVPSGFTQGTLTTATDVFVGNWTKLLIGQRMDLSVQFLTERYAELGQIAFLATWRGDVALARPRAFAVYRYLQGA